MQQITLYYNDESVKEIMTDLNTTYTKDRLVKIHSKSIEPFISNNDITLIDIESNRKVNKLLNTTKKNYSLTKSELMKDIAIVISGANLFTWFDQLPQGEQQLWNMVLNDIYVKKETADQLLNFEEKETRYFRYYYDNYEGLSWFNLLTSYANEGEGEDDYYGYKKKCYLNLPGNMQLYFNPILAREHRTEEDIPVEEPEKDEIANAELEAVTLLPHIYTMYEQSVITIGANKPVSAAALKAVKATGIRPFAPATDFVGCISIHEHFLTFVVAMMYQYERGRINTKTKPACDVIKYIFEKITNYSFYLFPVFTHYISGLTMADRKQNAINDLHTMNCVLLRQKGTQWNRVDDYLATMIQWMGAKAFYITLINPHESSSAKPIVNKVTSMCVKTNELVTNLGKPTVKAWLYMYASLGIIEFTTKAVPTEQIVSPYDNIDKFRLTKLGEYVMGVSKTYEMPQAIDGQSFETSQHNLIIRQLTPEAPFKHIIEHMATYIGNDRWAITPKSFLNDCKSKTDVETQIDRFRHYVDDKPSPVWEQFFQSMLSNCNPLQQEPIREKYLLYSVNPANRKVVEILTTDPIVRTLIIRAENHLLLIEKSNLAKVEKRLRDLGYLL